MSLPARPEDERSHSRPPLERMLRIHQALHSGSYPNATTLARQLEVSTKSIHRDLEFMRDRLELPIQYDAKRFGFFYTEHVKAFPTLQITEGEIFALVVAEKALQQYRGTSFERPLLSALKKMEQSLPDTLSLSLDDVAQTISFHTRAEPVLDLQIFDVLAKATASRRQLELTYRKPGQPHPEQRVVSGSFLRSIICARTSARLSPRASKPSAPPATPSSAGKHFRWTSVCAAVLACSPVRANSRSSSASTSALPSTFARSVGTTRSNSASSSKAGSNCGCNCPAWRKSGVGCSVGQGMPSSSARPSWLSGSGKPPGRSFVQHRPFDPAV